MSKEISIEFEQTNNKNIHNKCAPDLSNAKAESSDIKRNLKSEVNDAGNSKNTEIHLDNLDIENLDFNDLAKLQLQDPILKMVHDWLKKKNKTDWADVAKYGLEIKYFWYRWESLCLENNVLYRKSESHN
ncbi:hypothetical protein ACJMK2_003959 [Sinanodonta woodiana]|uniref:Uncharacterized protein n=1 Tax=Sinanodonta woodiana TaxID=1069815 RepID=A0ABD3XZS1_SINWO